MDLKQRMLDQISGLLKLSPDQFYTLRSWMDKNIIESNRNMALAKKPAPKLSEE